MKRIFTAFLIAGILIGAGSLSAKKTKVSGQVLDQQAFRGVHTYCIQTHDLGSHYEPMVESFFKEQDRPGSLVSELPWKKVDDCSKADAVMSFKFSETSEPSNATAGGSLYAGASMGTMNTSWFQVTAVVSSHDDKPIYQVEGQRAPERGERAMEKTFKELANDLKSIE